MEGIGIFLAILAVIGFLGAIPQLWGANWKKIWLVYYKGILSWDNVHKATLKVIEELRKHDFRPTVIIGVGRGGIVSAGLLCSELTGEDLVKSLKKGDEGIHSPEIKIGTINSTIFLKDVVLRQSKEGEKKLSSNIDKIELSDVNVGLTENERILIIVAQNFTGSTLEKATNILLSKGIPRDSIRTVALFWHKHENINIVHDPDVYGTIISINKTMPWKSYDISTDRY